jgi:hypothetical protein
MRAGGLAILVIQPTISLEMPVPSQEHADNNLTNQSDNNLTKGKSKLIII